MTRNRKRFFGTLLTFALMLGLMAGMSSTASAETEYVSVSTFNELSEAISKGKNVKLTDDIAVSSQIGVSSGQKIILDGNAHKLTPSGSTSGRAFNVNAGTLVLKNLTVTGFANNGGGAISNSGGTLVLDNCIFSGNSSPSSGAGGGAIESKNNGILYAAGTVFDGNFSGELGGAINNYNGSLYLTNCTFTNNYTTSSNGKYGGAIGYNSTNVARIIHCSFSNNYYDNNTNKKSDLGLYKTPNPYSIAGCGTITIEPSGTLDTKEYGSAVLDYSDLSNIRFIYSESEDHIIVISGGANATSNGGETTQFIKTGAMTTVTYTANTGYYFAEFTDITDNDITATRTNETTVTVSGTPTGNANINVPDAVLAHTHSYSYSASGATITANCTAGCPDGYDANGIVLTLSAGNATYTGSAYTGASLDSTAWTAAGLTVPAIEYSGRGNTSYTKSTTAPINAGDYTASVTADGKTATADFTIAPVTISSVAVTDITAPVATEALDTSAITSTANVTLSTVTWTPTTTPAAYATQYTATVIATAAANHAFADNAAASMNGETATVTRNQDGTLSISYTFEKTALTPATIIPATVTASNHKYDGTEKPLVTVTGAATGGTMQYALGENATTAPADNLYSTSIPAKTDAGTYHVWYKVVGDENHLDSEPACVAATIGRADISKAKVKLSKTSYACNGRAREPKVRSVTLGGKALRDGTDYVVSYKANVGPGTATASVAGKGNYRGTARATFSIVPARVRGLTTAGHPAEGTLDVAWDAVVGAKSYQLSWRVGGGKRRSRTVKGTSATIDGLRAGGCCEVRVRAKAGTATGAWSKVAGRWLSKASSLKAAAGKAKGTVRVSWAANAQATGGYVVYACAKKDGKVLARRAVAAGRTSATLTGLKSGRAYYVKVRPLREVSGTTYVGVQRYCKSTVKAK